MKIAITLNIIGFIGVVGIFILAMTAPDPSTTDGPANVVIFSYIEK